MSGKVRDWGQSKAVIKLCPTCREKTATRQVLSDTGPEPVTSDKSRPALRREKSAVSVSHLLSGLPQDELLVVLSQLLEIVESDGGDLSWLDLPTHRPQHVTFGQTVPGLVESALGDRVEPRG